MKKHSPKVSVVVPIYKVEEYLRECVDSILSQTLEDIEIILVDDGSPDNCPAICDEYAAKDKRVKVIHKENGGYATACNRGIQTATGDYIGLVESDDWIEPTMYEKLYNQITKFKADVCIGSFFEYKSKSIFPNGRHDKPYMETIENIDDTKLFSILDFPFLYTVHQSVWSKLYKKEFIKPIKFDEQPQAAYQDAPFMTEVFCRTNKIIGLKDFLYHYRVDNENSSSNNKNNSKKLMTVLDQMQVAKETLKKYDLFVPLKEEFFFQASKAGFRFYKNIDKKYKKEFFNRWRVFTQEIHHDDSYTFKYMNPMRKYLMQCVLRNDFRASLYDKYKVKRILGIPYYVKIEDKGVIKRKFLFGLLKIRKMPSYKKIYLCGVQVYVKKLRKSPADTVLAANRSAYNFIHYNKLAELLHPQIFLKYKDINKGQDVVLFACGLTANFFEKIPNCKYVGINRALYNAKIKFSQLFMHDDEFIRENEELLKNYDAEKFCAFHTNEKNAKEFKTVTERLKVIQAHRFIISDPGRGYVGTSVPDVINPDISKGMLYDRGGGTVFSALQFILYTHPKRIYLVGCDCTSEGYFYSLKNNKGPIPAYWTDPRQGKNILLSKLKKLWLEASYVLQDMYPDIEIISVNPVALKGLFKDVYTQSYLDEHPELVSEQVEILTGEAANG